MKRPYQFGIVATALLVVAAAITFPIPGGSPVSWERMKSLSNAKQLAIACKIYASDHEGRFPVHLSELEPDFIPKGALDQLRCSSMARDGDPRFLMDWLYFGGGFGETNPPRLLIASPQATTTGKQQKRVIIEGDTSGRVVSEADFLQLLGETIRQMRAENQKRSGTPSLKTGPGVEKSTTP